MSNMSYCRFYNTYSDLKDCLDNIDNFEMGIKEAQYRNKLINLCQRIIDCSMPAEDFLEVIRDKEKEYKDEENKNE